MAAKSKNKGRPAGRTEPDIQRSPLSLQRNFIDASWLVRHTAR
jgi:hypothetical protein